MSQKNLSSPVRKLGSREASRLCSTLENPFTCGNRVRVGSGQQDRLHADRSHNLQSQVQGTAGRQKCTSAEGMFPLTLAFMAPRDIERLACAPGYAIQKTAAPPCITIVAARGG